MKIYNLDQEKEILINSGVVIIGSGPVGLFTAWQLSKLNIEVNVFEAGNKKIPTEFMPIYCDKQIYQGLKKGRKQVLGGTSTVWGGALIPFLKQDFEPHPLGWHQGWPIRFNSLSKYFKEIESFFGLKKNSFNLEKLDENKFLFRRKVYWPKFKRRNVYNSLKKVTNKNNKINIYYNAKVLGFNLCKNGKYIVEILDSKGRSFKITSHKIFLTAGAIESYRIVSKLLSKFKNKKKMLEENGFGKYFQDHLSAPIAKIKFKESVNLSSKVGIKFHNCGMTNYRYEISHKMQKEFKIPSGFIHLSFERNKNTPFEILRSVLQDLQANKIPEIKKIFILTRNIFYLVKVLYYRIVLRQLFIDQHSHTYLNLVLEQVPLKSNKFIWSMNKHKDKEKKLFLSWQIGKGDLKNFQKSIIPICKEYNKIEALDIKEIIYLDQKKVMKHLSNEAEVYHPVGFFSFSKKNNIRVVNSKMELNGFKNLHILNTGVFPSAGGANPTMTLLLISAYLTNKIYKSII